jgi:tyrosine-specific transport protein
MKDIVYHQGIFKKNISVLQGAALITSATIGAGVLGIPYVVSKVGVTIGLVCIILIGLLTIGINQLVGALTLETNDDLQLVGYVRTYLGTTAGVFMTAVTYISMFGSLTIYLIGQGVALSAIFGGDPIRSSLMFFAVGSALIYIGIHALKRIEFLLTILILVVILIIAVLCAPYITPANVQYTDWSQILLPYGVLLFAFHGTTAIPEVKALLSHKPDGFKQAIRIAGYFSIVVYALFAIVIVGVTGANTTQIATIGLGEVLGDHMLILGNIFAVLAMGTSFLITGLALRDSLSWDYKIPNRLATAIVCGVPLIIFLFGVREFIALVDIVGGVFVSTIMFLLILAYWRAARLGHAPPLKYKLHHTFPFVAVAMIALTIGAIYSVIQFL